MSGADARPCVLVFAGLDPSGGAGLTADAQAIAGQGAHALTVCTALTVQDNDCVYGVRPVEAELVLRQAQALAGKMAISAVKIGITGSAANAQAIAEFIVWLRARGDAMPRPELPVVLDPVLASGHGDLLSRDDAVQAVSPLLPLTTVLTPNGPEAQALGGVLQPAAQAAALRARGCRHILITGGHGDGDEVVNRWYGPGAPIAGAASGAAAVSSASAGTTAAALSIAASAASTRATAAALTVAADGSGPAPCPREWRWPRLDGAFHGSGCTLASAIAGQLALGLPTAVALEYAQHYVYHALRDAYAIAAGQRIPLR
ncbi:hydroxymethylpyrimidine/phosphomethylpyrimidine kinase [Pseudoduganella sp. FT25W]|uniref:hydroxymethylpyrimidine kinase n=1 Tax=Duganella alba TaxID=2666081 RepID=A0A6L5QJB7_9BURK|nr:hydroxymethylpyrimidine/phosphomethylpyrimidine kinase [Duganella alba]MRX09755.1 hydroxymethylpyrimidine/phosphomethylpyrimidine kinase [Duganella alba]MRX17392.1 hydroxymethylpyrimidine/phosphomethylpyrimidine kinase [Duganella alba]